MSSKVNSALVVGPGPRPGTIRVRCPRCGRIHVHREPRIDGEYQPAPCGTPSGYHVTWFWRPEHPADDLQPAVCSLCGSHTEAGGLGICQPCIDAAPWMRLRTNRLPATVAEEEEERNEYRLS